METSAPSECTIPDIPAYVEGIKFIVEERKRKKKQAEEDEKIERQRRHMPHVEELLRKCREAAEAGSEEIEYTSQPESKLLWSFLELTGMRLTMVKTTSKGKAIFKFILPK